MSKLKYDQYIFIFLFCLCFVRHMSNRKRVQVSFTEEQWELIEKLEGKLGDSDSAVVRNIVVSWLAEKSFISNVVKEEMKVVKENGEPIKERDDR